MASLLQTVDKLITETDVILLGKKNLRYFGILSYGLKKTVFAPGEPGYAKLPSYVKGTFAATDGKKIFFIVQEGLTREDIIFATLHETLHIISGHIVRFQSRDRLLWNLATDHVINCIIKDISSKNNKVTFSDNCVYFEEIAKEHPNASAEIVYEILCKEVNRNAPSKKDGPKNPGGPGGSSPSSFNQKGKDNGDSNGSQTDGNGDDENTPSSSIGEDNRRYSYKIYDGPCGIKIATFKDHTNGKEFSFAMDATFMENGNAEEDKKCEAALKNLKQKAKSLWHSPVVNKGDFPGNMISYFDEIFKIETPWNTLLESAILYPVQTEKRRSWTMPNFYYRRFARVPGKWKNNLGRKILVVGIDSSGSISDDDLKIFLGIVLDSTSYFDGLYILVHDVDVQQEFIFEKRPDKNQLVSQIREIKGRGGTSHHPVFERITQLNEDYLISSVIFLTDYCSDVESIYSNFDWFRELPSIWLVTSELEVKFPDYVDYKHIRIPSGRDLATSGRGTSSIY
jgi:predicted metal-dependent peptidase